MTTNFHVTMFMDMCYPKYTALLWGLLSGSSNLENLYTPNLIALDAFFLLFHILNICPTFLESNFKIIAFLMFGVSATSRRAYSPPPKVSINPAAVTFQ